MTAREIRIISVLASIFSLRMLGLAMLLPVFAVEALNYKGATPELIGLAVGIYGLAQAGLQLPFGILSDRFGRKYLILAGLSLLLLGSLIAASATSIYGLIIGRSLQGCSAIGSVVIATMLDHTRAEKRTLAMAVLGIGIGLSFALAMVLGPGLNQSYGMTSLFWLTAMLAGISLLISSFTIPKNHDCRVAIKMASFSKHLLELNFGVFVLHASLAALFLVLPLRIKGLGVSNLWQIYAAVIVVSMLLTIKFMRLKHYIVIITLLIAEILLFVVSDYYAMVASLILFFTAFCSLEASLPTLVSKFAPANNRGAAMGVYSTLQFLGVFFGGIIGGWLHGKFGILSILVFCVLLAAAWLGIIVISKRIEVKSWLEA